MDLWQWGWMRAMMTSCSTGEVSLRFAVCVSSALVVVSASTWLCPVTAEPAGMLAEVLLLEQLILCCSLQVAAANMRELIAVYRVFMKHPCHGMPFLQ